MFTRNQKNVVYILIFILPFFIFFQKSDFFANFRSGISSSLIGPIKILSQPLFEIKKMLYYHRTFDEYLRLRQEVNTLRERVIGQDELLKENSRLEKLLEFKRNLLYSSVAANVIGRNPSYWNSSVIIDKGKEDGIDVGMAVVTGGGIVGKVAEAGEGSSKVILVTDPSFSVAALVQRPRETVLISGSLSGKLRMRYIDPDAQIKGGDTVITSKLSESFPESIMIGQVIEIAEENPQLTEYVVKPAVTLSQLEEVLVIQK